MSRKKNAPTAEELAQAQEASNSPEQDGETNAVTALLQTPEEKLADLRAKLPSSKKEDEKQEVAEEEAEEVAEAEESENDSSDEDDRIGTRRNSDEEDDEDDGSSSRTLSEETIELAEEFGMSRSEARKQAEEFGGEAAFKKALRLAMRAPRIQKIEQRADDKKSADKESNSSDVASDLESLIQEFQLDGDWGEDTKKVIGQVGKYSSDITKAVAKEIKKHLDGLRGQIESIRAQEVARQTAEITRSVDKLFAEAAKESDEYADLFGEIPVRRLPENSPLKSNRTEVWTEMQDIQQRRIDRGREPLELEELFRKALDSLYPEKVETRVRNKIVNERSQIRGTRILRPNARSSKIDEMPRGPERAARRLEEQQRKLGLIR